MGADGTDGAVETADAALVGDELRRPLDPHDPGERTLGVVRQDRGASVAVDGEVLVLGAVASLSPALAAVTPDAPSVSVALDPARLVRDRLDRPAAVSPER